ncbi:hypothetical protein T05_3504 [Trichinella murrelli]|uniref:Uncharacterized protein n=1 Tax=Trichinella murrelli TaxID=144512 RepID=A0A0V0UEZ7_9BILA|nr:hypothetical protein T05_10124 [Trichinella murrelli]KRX49581.1 hypothetical protein T05_14373 [Trichinella murrelli]KRX49582.1 hypothetical protein T05_3504 [Trichinella murrelli]
MKICHCEKEEYVYERTSAENQYDHYEEHEYEQYTDLDAVVITIDKEPEKAYSSRGRINRE